MPGSIWPWADMAGMFGNWCIVFRSSASESLVLYLQSLSVIRRTGNCGNYGEWHSESTENDADFSDNYVIAMKEFDSCNFPLVKHATLVSIT